MKKLLIIFLVSVLYLIPGYSARFLFSELSITPDETNNKIKNIDSLFSLSSQYIATDNEIALLYIKKGKQLLVAQNIGMFLRFWRGRSKRRIAFAIS